MKPKHEEIREIDNWVCCWCGKNVNDNTNLNLHRGWDAAKCPHCGKINTIYFSIEYMSQPEWDVEVKQ